MRNAMKALELERLWVVYPGDRAYPLAEGIGTLPMDAIEDTWRYD